MGTNFLRPLSHLPCSSLPLWCLVDPTPSFPCHSLQLQLQLLLVVVGLKSRWKRARQAVR